MNNEQQFSFNGVTATVRQRDNGDMEISGDDFICDLIAFGFRLGRNNTPERFAEILKHVPPEFRQDFVDGFNSPSPSVSEP